MKSPVSSLTLISVAFIFLITSACKKDAGEGGTSTIQGKVIVYRYDNAFLSVEDTFAAVDDDVFIVYGAGSSIYDDKYSTSYDGSYRFKYLQKGTYRLFAYSKDTTGAATGTVNPSRPKVPVFVDVTISDKGSTVTAPDIIIIKN